MTTKMADTKEQDKYLVVKNGGEFIMLFPTGNAFLYPGAEVLITNPVSADQVKRWKDIGCQVREVTKQESESLSSGILGLK